MWNSSGANVSRVPANESMLNPYAQAFQPNVYSDRHCLYLTFSNGFPLTESQIFHFFNRLYAPFVAEVFVHRPRVRGKPSLFGKVVFTRSTIPDIVMGNHERVSLCVDGRPLYCRRFVTRKTKTTNVAAATASTSHHGGA